MEHRPQWEAMRGDDQEATVLRLFTFSGKRKENAWKELSEYQKECGVKNDSDTRMESYLYGTEEYLIGQKMRVLFSLSSKLFLMMALFISAFFVNGIKILSELSGYERRYEFLRCMGMKQKQRRKTIRFETQMLSDIALFATVMMGIVYVLSYEWRCASKDAGSLDVTFWMYWILIVGIYLLADRLVQWLFAQYAKHLQIEWVHRYFKGIILIVGAIWLLFAVFSLIFAYRNIRKIEGDSRDGKK